MAGVGGGGGLRLKWASDLHQQKDIVSRDYRFKGNFPKKRSAPAPRLCCCDTVAVLFSPVGVLCGQLMKTWARPADKRCAGSSQAGVPLSLTPGVLIVDD